MMKPISVRNAVIVGVTVIVLMTGILRAMGRTWWCKCGSWYPTSWDIWSSHNSQHLIDPYFFTHVLHGVIFCWVLMLFGNKLSVLARGLVAVVIEAGWEILENSPLIINRYREVTISLDYFGDSILNSVFDVVACLMGYVIASKVGWKISIAFFVLTELVLLLAIRDNLTLNIIMLVSPIEAIKDWQSP